jgi:hypothetical protein
VSDPGRWNRWLPPELRVVASGGDPLAPGGDTVRVRWSGTPPQEHVYRVTCSTNSLGMHCDPLEPGGWCGSLYVLAEPTGGSRVLVRLRAVGTLVGRVEAEQVRPVLDELANSLRQEVAENLTVG